MSGSPMYSVVSLDPGLMALGMTLRAARSAARRAREDERRAEREALAAERARRLAERQARARAAAERRRAELAERRRVRQETHAAGLREEQGRADARRLDEAESLLAPLRGASDRAAELASLRRRLADLRAELGGPRPLGADIEELRGLVVVATGGTAERAAAVRPDPGEVLRDLLWRLAGLGADAAAHDAAGARECAELLDRMGALAAQPDAGVRFEALLGSAEHALNRHAHTVARAVEDATARAEEEALRAEEEAARAEEERAAREEAERAALAEALDRFGVVEDGARDAVHDAADLGAPELAAEVERTLRTATEALGTRHARAALDAVAALETLLPSVEEQLDELQLAHARRTELARALKDAMTDAGLDFTGGEDRGELLVLSFERQSGAVYEATVRTESDGTPLLTYHVDGEPDMSIRPAARGEAVCAPEELLDLVHRALDGSGFTSGELTWDGKPPRDTARQLPGTDRRRAR
ncbi:hypothetical protein ABZZ79_09025 [Streptomyces sp. NPDC006458]|uniref:hypothetical protein n=1 Tax=Streptomyces sp. NPDC006458 TaxID=3154302 RepID=UPI0033BD4C32